MYKKKMLSLFLAACLMVGMVPAALADEEPLTTAAETPDTTTVDGFHKFVDGKITEANQAKGTSDYMTLKREGDVITVDFKNSKLVDTVDKINGTGLVDLIYEVVQASDGCALKGAPSYDQENDPNKVIRGEDVEVSTETTKDALRGNMLEALLDTLASDPAVLTDGFSIGALLNLELPVSVKLKAKEGSTAGPINYTFQFACTSNNTQEPDAPVFAQDKNVAEIGEGYVAAFTLSANAPKNVIYRVYDASTGGKEVAGVYANASVDSTRLTLNFEKAKVPTETTTYYISAEKFTKASTSRTPVTVVVTNYGAVAPTTGKNLATVGATVTGNNSPYSVAITGTDIVPGLEAFNTDTLKSVYNDFNPTTGSTWDRIPEAARNSNFTIVTLDFPAAPNASGIEIKQSSKALKDFYCAGKAAGATSDLDNRIVVDTGAATATKTHTYTADKDGKISLSFLMAADDTVTFTVKHDADTTVTYTVTATGLTFKDKGKVEVNAPGFAISTSDSILGKKASDLMLNAALSADSADPTKFTVTGTAKHVKDWTEFDATLHTGHYLALTVTKPDNLPADANYSVKVSGDQDYTFPKDKFFTEGSGKTETLTMYLDNLIKNKKGIFTVAFDWDGNGTADATYTFDVSGMSLVEEKAVVEVKPTVTGDKASASVPKDDITTAISAATDTTGGATPDPVVVIDATKGADGSEITSAKSAAITLPKEAVSALDTAANSKADLTVNIATPVGTVEINNQAIAALKAAAGTEDIVLNVEEKTGTEKPSDAASTEAYEVNFQTVTSQKEVPVTSANLTLTLRFSGITDPAAIKIANDSNLNERINPTYKQVSAGTYDLTFTVSHLTTFYAVTASTPTPTTGTVTKTETSDSVLGKTFKFTVAGAGSSITNAFLTVNAKRGSGSTAVNFCTVVPVTLTSGAGSNVAELYFQSDVTITGAWVTSGKPTLTDGKPAGGSILASLQP